MHQDGMAVGISLGDGANADGSASARPIFDDDGLTDIGRDVLEERARKQIGCAAWGKWHDNSNRFRRPSLCHRGHIRCTVASDDAAGIIANAIRILLVFRNTCMLPSSARSHPQRERQRKRGGRVLGLSDSVPHRRWRHYGQSGAPWCAMRGWLTVEPLPSRGGEAAYIPGAVNRFNG